MSWNYALVITNQLTGSQYIAKDTFTKNHHEILQQRDVANSITGLKARVVAISDDWLGFMMTFGYDINNPKRT